MNNLAQLIHHQETRLTGARVLRCREATLWLEEEGESYPARRAAACLLEPRVGDLVLVAHLEGGRAYVTSVLERNPHSGPARLGLEGDLEISAPSGRLEISARDGLELTSPRRASLAAPELELTALQSRFSLGALRLLAQGVRAGLGKVNLVARALDSVVERLSQRLKFRQVKVEELDSLEAATISVEAEDLHSLRTEYSVISAAEDVKVDAGMIHLG